MTAQDEPRPALLAGVVGYVCTASGALKLDAAAPAALGWDDAPEALADLLERVFPPDREAFDAAIRAALAGGPPQPQVVRFRGSDGRLHHVRHVAQREGEVVHGALQNVDDVVSATSRGRFEVGVGFAVARGVDAILVEVNDAFVDAFRTSEANVVGRRLDSLFESSAAADAARALASAEASGHERFETTMVRADGEVFTALFDVIVPRNADQDVQRFVTVLDISDIRDREKTLRIYREIFDNLPFGVLMARLEDPSDPGQFRFIDGNTFVRTRWASHGGILGRTIAEAYPAMLDTQVPQMYLDALRTNEPQRLTGQPMGRRGEVFDLRVARVDADLVAVIYDEVSEREALLAELKRLNGELERSNAELADFAAVASHDIQAPLRSIVSFAQVVREELDGSLTDEVARHLGFIESSASRLRRLVTDLLEYAQVGKREAEFGEVDIEELLTQVRTDLSHEIAETGAVVEGRDLHVVVGDGPMLRQLLQNLIANAIKFHRDIPPRVEVRSEAGVDGWTMTVSDNGIGVPSDQLERVFGAFRRLHTVRRYPGSGIGLAVCKRIVEYHGGRIWMESTEGEGTRVRFSLARSAMDGHARARGA